MLRATNGGIVPYEWRAILPVYELYLLFVQFFIYTVDTKIFTFHSYYCIIITNNKVKYIECRYMISFCMSVMDYWIYVLQQGFKQKVMWPHYESRQHCPARR